jgi:hypothetical protein
MSASLVMKMYNEVAVAIMEGRAALPPECAR